MPALINAFDAYERRARLYPMLLILLPAILGIASWLPAEVDIGGLLGGTLASVVLAALFGQIARDEGKRREPHLFARWGGTPSVRALSFEGNVFDSQTLHRIHRVLEEVDNDLRFPENAQEEASDRDFAFSVYQSSSELLLSKTRDPEHFRLVFTENVNYGYRRNLWAMKVPGIVSAALGIIAGLGRLAVTVLVGLPMSWTALASVSVGATFLALLSVRVTEDWVRLAADAFARQLCLAAQSIPSRGR